MVVQVKRKVSILECLSLGETVMSILNLLIQNHQLLIQTHFGIKENVQIQKLAHLLDVKFGCKTLVISIKSLKMV